MKDYKQVVIPKLLKQLRVKADLRQLDLANLLKKPQSYVSKYESGEKTLDFIEVHEICRSLNISLIDFVKLYEENVNESKL